MRLLDYILSMVLSLNRSWNPLCELLRVTFAVFSWIRVWLEGCCFGVFSLRIKKECQIYKVFCCLGLTVRQWDYSWGKCVNVCSWADISIIENPENHLRMTYLHAYLSSECTNKSKVEAIYIFKLNKSIKEKFCLFF